MQGESERRDWDAEFAALVGEPRLVRAPAPPESSAAEHVERLRRHAELNRRLAERAEQAARERRMRTQRAERRARLGRRLVVVLPILLVVVAAGWYEVNAALHDHESRAEAQEARPAGWPSQPAPRADRPLGAPAAPPVGEGGYEFARMQPAGPAAPVAFDPCTTVRFVVRDGEGAAALQPLLDRAIAQLETATGLRFQPEGPTAEAPATDRAPVQRDRYGDRWAPVLVAFSDATETPGLAGSVTGLTDVTTESNAGSPVIRVTGQVVLDRADLITLSTEPDGGAAAEAVILHELGHLVGLAHTNDPTQLMYPDGTGATSLGAGDLRGLARLGSGACVPTI